MSVKHFQFLRKGTATPNATMLNVVADPAFLLPS